MSEDEADSAAAAAAETAPQGSDDEAEPNGELRTAQDWLRERVADACHRLNTSLAKLRCGDIKGEGGGLTEAGLKLGLIVALGDIPEVRIESERSVDVGRDKCRHMDLVLTDKTHMCALVVELKYVRCGYMRRSHFRTGDPPEREFLKLNAAALAIAGMEWDEVKREAFLDPESNERPRQWIPISRRSEEAQSQARGYARAVATDSVPIRVQGERVRDIACCTVIGAASRCYFDPE